MSEIPAPQDWAYKVVDEVLIADGGYWTKQFDNLERAWFREGLALSISEQVKDDRRAS